MTPEQLAAELYDVSVPDWEGEIDFYRELAREVKQRGLTEKSSEMIWVARNNENIHG